MLTAAESAEWMAFQVIAAAKGENGGVVTRGLVDDVMRRYADREQGAANKETVRRIVRKQAAAECVRVVFTDEERYWAIREQLHHMSADQVCALRDSIADGGDDDPRGNDRVLIDAISVRLSNRVPPRRLDGVEPVSVRLWREPCRPAVEEQRATVEASDPAVPDEDVTELYAPGEQVRVTPQHWDQFHKIYIPQPEFVGTVVGYTRNGNYMVREPKHGTSRHYDVRRELHRLAATARTVCGSTGGRELSTVGGTAPEPDAVGVMPEHAQNPTVTAALEILRSTGVRVATLPGRKMLYREWHGPQGPQGAFIWPGEGRSLEVCWFVDGAQDERGMRSRSTRTVRAARNTALDEVAEAFRVSGWKVWRVESSNTATRRALRLGVTPPSDERPSAVVSLEEADALVVEFGIGEGVLDEAVYEAANEGAADEYNAHPEGGEGVQEEVHGAADVRASGVNNRGAAAQVRFLAEFCGSVEALRSLLVDLVGQPFAEQRAARLAAISGPLDASVAEAFANMYAAVADGSAIPVPVAKVRVGMVVVAAVRLEDRAVGTVTRRSGTGRPWVGITWKCRSRQDSVAGDRRVFAPDDYVMVTVESLEALGMLADPRDHVRAWELAGKWVAAAERRRESGLRDEPTDEALAAVFATCVQPPKPALYPLIRAEITGWDDRDGLPPAERQ